MDYKRFLVSSCVAGTISLFVFFVSNDFGITWDEPVHMGNADSYVAWYKRPELNNTDAFFRPNAADVHPPLRKLIGGITHDILTNRLRVIDNTRGYRISALLFVFPFIVTFSYIAIGRFGYAVGILVPFMYSLLPHVLFLTPIFTMDYAIASLWFLAVVTGIKGMKSFRWLTLAGIFIGLTMLTKLHGFLLFAPVLFYWLWHFRNVLVKKNRLKRKLDAIIRLMSVCGVALFVYGIGWPWLWTDPMDRLGEYFRMQLTHLSVPVYVLGNTYAHAPWWYTPLMFLVTTPVFVLLFFLIGTVFTIRKGGSWNRLMLVNALYPMTFFSLPWVYRYDWVRLFLASFPFVCLLAGRGIVTLLRSVAPSVRSLVMTAVVLVWAGTVYSSVIRIHPWESSYYNELVGGIAGASRLGFETEYWGNAYLGVLPWMNAHKKDMMCVTPTPFPFYYYQAMGAVEPGVVFAAGRGACTYAVVLMRQGLFIRDPFIAKVVRTQKPVYVLTVDGVALVGIYDISMMNDE